MSHDHQRAFTIVSVHSPFVCTVLILTIGLLSSSCNVSYHSITPEMKQDSRYFSIYEDGIKTQDAAQYVVKDSSGIDQASFMMSGVRIDSKRGDWNLQFFPNLGLLFEHEHTLQVDIKDSRDSTVRTLFSSVHESADGEFSSTALGDTVLILDKNGRAGYLLRRVHPRSLLSLRPNDEEYEIAFNNVRTTIQHHFEAGASNDWLALYAGDDYVACIGDMSEKFLGKIVYQMYVKNGVSSAFQPDLFFVYLGMRGFRSIQDGIVYLQKKRK